ncbi:MAG: hypothetical protein ABWX81_09135 [Pseudolabrys sp.]
MDDVQGVNLIANHHVVHQCVACGGCSDDRAADVIERAFGRVLTGENGPENSTGTN